MRSPVVNCLVALVDVAGEQVGGESIRPGDDDRRDAGHVGREARRVQGADVLLRGHEHLAAEVAALLLARELVLPVDRGGAGLDQRLRELVGVERTAEAGLGVGDDRREPVLGDLALGVLELVLTDQRVVDAADHRRHRVRGVERLVGVGLPGEVAVGRDLPAREVDRLEPCTHLLHGLAAGVGAERPHVVLGVQQVPEVLGAAVGERGVLADRAADADDVVGRVGALDAVPPGIRLPDLLELGGRLHLVAGAQTCGAGCRGSMRCSSWCLLRGCPVREAGWRVSTVGEEVVTIRTDADGEDRRKFCFCDRIGRMSTSAVEEDADALTIGRRIRQLRTARGMTLDDLAAAVDRAPSQMSMIETGKREPKLTQLQAIARALGVTIDALLEGEPLDERSAIEIALERAMKGQTFQALGIEPFRIAQERADGCAEGAARAARRDRSAAGTSARRRPRRPGARTSSCVT